MARWTNWSRTVRAQPSQIAAPQSEGEASTRMREAPVLRALGGGCSASELCVTPGVLLDARGLRAIHPVDSKTQTVRVGGGVTLGDLAESLAAQDYRLAAVGSNAYPTVAGGLATALHGSASAHGTLSDAASVRGMRLVLASGEVVSLSDTRAADGHLLEAARVHLGALGLVTEVTLAVQRGAWQRRRTEPVVLEQLQDPDVHVGWDHVEAWWLPYTQHAILHRRGEATSGTARGALARDARRLLAEDVPLRALIAAIRVAPSGVRPLMDGLARATRATRDETGRWDRLTLGPRWLKAVDMEVALPAAALSAALAVVERVAQTHAATAPLHLPVNLRWVRADAGALLSPAAGRDTVYVDIAWHPSVPGGHLVLAEIEAGLTALGGRPHWGKLAFANPAACVPGLPAWNAVRRQLDPEDRLLNDHLRRLLSGAPLRAVDTPIGRPT